MSNQILKTVAKAFRVTKNRLKIDEEIVDGQGNKQIMKIKCDNDWIGNGFWFIKRAYEPNFLNEYKIEEDNILALEPILKKIKKSNREIVLENDLKMYAGDRIAIKFRTSSTPTWADVFFIGLFDSVQSPSRNLRFWQGDNNQDPILIKVGDDDVGIVAPFEPISSVG